MKKGKIFWLSLLVPIILWFGAPVIAAYPGWVYRLMSDDCAMAVVNSNDTGAIKRCDDMFAHRGQAGDVYGTVGSLFTGLALFGVAYSLLSDLTMRRQERKPIVVCGFAEHEDVLLSNPSPNARPKTATIDAKLTVRVLNDSAINTNIVTYLRVGDQRTEIAALPLGMPLRDGDSTHIELSRLLPREVITELERSFPNVPRFALEFNTTCENLDGERFETKVEYRIMLRYGSQTPKLLWLASDDPGNREAWADLAPIALSATLEPGTWKFRHFA